MGEAPNHSHAELEEREQQIVDRLARIRKQSPAQVRAEARRRALRYEAESMRRQ